MNETKADLPRYLDNLTALRFPAALLVVLHHVAPHFVVNPAVRTVSSYGYVGVGFFFMLSGFVLTWSGIPRSHQSFWWRRISRIVPMTIVFSLIAFTVMAHSQLIPGGWAIAQNFALLQAWNPHKSAYFGGNGVTWSLSCELFFYATFPFIIRPISRLGRRQLAIIGAATFLFLAIPPCVAAAVNVNPGMQYWIFYIFPPYRFGEFLIGVLLARAVRLGFSDVQRRHVVAGAICAALSLCAVAVVATETQSEPFISLFLVPVFGFLLVAGALRHRRTTARQSPRLLVKLGEWSFALYLLHQLFFRATLSTAFGPQGLAGPLGLVVFVAAAIALAGVCCALIERPCLRLLTRRSRGTPRLVVADARAA